MVGKGTDIWDHLLGDGIRENGYHQSHVVSGATSSPCWAQVVSFLAAVYDIDKAKENKRKSKR
jgi:hypothetical protein